MNGKKLLTWLLLLALALGLAAPALAADVDDEFVTVTVSVDELAENALGDDADLLLTTTAAEAKWYDEAVAYVTEKGIMVGTDKGFEPEALTTRASVFQTLYNMEGKPSYTEQTPPEGHLASLSWASATGRFYQDVAGKWYEACAKWAYGAGLTTGDENSAFQGERNVTRAELVTILYRYAQLKEMDVSWAEDTNILSYDDAFTLPAWSVTGFQWAAAYGVLDGKPTAEGGMALGHGDNATRAELAALLMRFDRLGLPQGAVAGKAIDIHKYGNVTVDVTAEQFAALGFEPGDVLTVRVKGQTLSAPYGSAYANVDVGNLIILPNNKGLITVAINMGSFANTYAVEKGDELSFAMGEKAGYLDEYTIRNIESLRTNERADYAALSDEEFANFRMIATTGMGTGKLYRSSSPINPEIGRNTYADAAAQAAGIKAILNLTDSQEVAEAYEGYADTYYSKQQIAFLNMDVDFASEVNKAGLVTAMEFLAAQEGPYLLHCTEGKDRAGFVSALLECLMGATYEEVKADYMVTFSNYYGVTAGTEQYEKIAAIVLDNLATTFGVEDLSTADLAGEAEAYLKGLGVTEATIAAVRANLGGETA